MDPLIRIPFLAAPPIPPKKVSGMEITSAHGQDTTRQVSASLIHWAHAWPNSSGGMTASRTAAITTTGV